MDVFLLNINQCATGYPDSMIVITVNHPKTAKVAKEKPMPSKFISLKDRITANTAKIDTSPKSTTNSMT